MGVLLFEREPDRHAVGDRHELDGVFFNWMTPEFAARARRQVEEGAEEAGRQRPPVFGYVRTAVGEDAAERLSKEESFYRDLHAGYRNHFDRLEEPEGTVGVSAADRDEAQPALAAYEATGEDRASTREEMLRLVEQQVERSWEAAPRYFGRLPRANCTVKATVKASCTVGSSVSSDVNSSAPPPSKNHADSSPRARITACSGRSMASA